MAAGATEHIIRSPGKLVVNPTTEFYGGTYPYGGTEVGKARGCVVRSLGTSFRVESEALGEAVDILESDNRWVFACFLRGWDDDAIANLLEDAYEVGPRTQHAVYAVPGNATPGASAMLRAVTLAYVPDDPIFGIGAMIYRGIASIEDGGEIPFTRTTETGIPLVVDCLRDDNNWILKIGRLSDLLLTP